MNILIAGGTGFIGNNLAKNLYQKHNLTLLTRKNINSYKYYNNVINWDNLVNHKNNFDIIINLCGYNIANKRWSKNVKQKILNSRLISTKKLIDYIGNSKTFLINASAIGFYAFSTQRQTEKRIILKNQKTFSQEITHQWENIVNNSNIKNSTIIRFGVVLGNDGFIKKLLTPIKFNMGAIIGNGEQIISWIYIKDLCNAINYIIDNKLYNKTYNLTTKFSFSQKEITKKLCEIHNKKLFLSMPSSLVKIIFGQMGKELLLSSQNIYPENLLNDGFNFKYDDLDKALKDLFN